MDAIGGIGGVRGELLIERDRKRTTIDLFSLFLADSTVPVYHTRSADVCRCAPTRSTQQRYHVTYWDFL